MQWMDQATCRTMDPDLFLTEHKGAQGDKRKAKALAACARCPVQMECRDTAIDLARNGMVAGIWGGLTARQITDLAKAQA